MVAIMLAATTLIGLSSFVAADEDPYIFMEARANSCEYLCWYESNGQKVPVLVTGSTIDCVNVGYESTCSPSGCYADCD